MLRELRHLEDPVQPCCTKVPRRRATPVVVVPLLDPVLVVVNLVVLVYYRPVLVLVLVLVTTAVVLVVNRQTCQQLQVGPGPVLSQYWTPSRSGTHAPCTIPALAPRLAGRCKARCLTRPARPGPRRCSGLCRAAASSRAALSTCASPRVAARRRVAPHGVPLTHARTQVRRPMWLLVVITLIFTGGAPAPALNLSPCPLPLHREGELLGVRGSELNTDSTPETRVCDS